jgi:hypothetical protein
MEKVAGFYPPPLIMNKVKEIRTTVECETLMDRYLFP